MPKPKKKGATTTDLKVAVKEVGYDKPKAISRAMAIARDKLVKEGMMPEKKTKAKKKAVRKPAVVAQQVAIKELRDGIRGLHVQMKSLDGALRKEQTAERSAARAKFYKKSRKFTVRAVKSAGSVIAWPFVSAYKLARHPIETPKAAYHYVAKSWVSWPFRKLRAAASAVSGAVSKLHSKKEPAENTA